MKILQPGREQTGWAMEKECTGKGNGNGGCGAKLLVEEADVYATFWCFAGDCETLMTFKCGSCGVATDFEIGEVPGWLHDRAKTHENTLR